MKATLFLAVSGLVLASFSSAFASDAGEATLTLYRQYGGVTAVEIRDTGSAILGQATGSWNGNSMINLQKNADGSLQGFMLGRGLHVLCTAESCTDLGSTNLELTITHAADGTHLDGQFNFAPVHIVLSDNAISIDVQSIDAGAYYSLTKDSEGHFSGQGALTRIYGINSFTADLSSSGSLAGLKDPAVAVAFLVSPFIQ
jgi:hypothetical protein